MLLGSLVACEKQNESKQDAIKVSENPENNTQHKFDTVILPPISDSNVSYSNYTVTMELDPENRKLTAIERIKYKNDSRENLDNLYMNVYLNSFGLNASTAPFPQEYKQEVYKNGLNYSNFKLNLLNVNNEPSSYSLDGSLLEIRLSETLKPDEEIEITLDFEAYLPEINHIIGGSKEAFWAGNALPSMAVFENGEWNTSPYLNYGKPFYSNVGNYDVSITTPENYDIIGPGSSTSSIESGKKTTRIQAKMIRDFAFTASNAYHKATIETADGIDINLYYHSANMRDVEQFLKFLKNTLEYYINNIGSYPYQKLSIVECSLFDQLEAEFPQLILIDSHMLTELNPKKSFGLNIGFQWFNNIVGTDESKHGWLNNGIVSFLSVCQSNTEKELEKIMIATREDLTLLENGKLLSLNTPLNEYTSYKQYHNTAWKKSMLMIYELYQRLGKEAFLRLMQDYYSIYSFQNVKPFEFIRLSEKKYGDSLDNFFQQWIENDGLPAKN